MHAEGRKRLYEAYGRCAAGISRGGVLGRPVAYTFGSIPGYVPPASAVAAASTYRGKIQPKVAALLRDGRILDHGTSFLQDQSEMRWAAGTAKNKRTAVTQFKAFLETAGMSCIIRSFAGDEVKSTGARRKEENLLGVFGMTRVMAGLAIPTVESYIALIRTWYEWKCGAPLGIRGGDGVCGGAVAAVRSLREYFPPKDPNADVGRSPITLEILKALVLAALADGNVDLAAAMVLAFNGLYRMGEITATKGAFNFQTHLAETDVTFLPSFAAATHVSIRIGASKADQDGETAKHHPRVLPVTKDFLSAGRWLKILFAKRFNVGAHQSLPVTAVSKYKPLLQDAIGNHLKESAVLAFVRRVLIKDNGYSKPAAANFGTHSFRIGGFTRYFHLGTPIEVLKRIGGWSSDAWVAYLRFQRENGMKYSARMCCEDA